MPTILSIKPQKDWTASLTNAIPLCILRSDDTSIGWYYENYMKIYTHLNCESFFECNLLDALDYSTGGYIENRLLRYSYIPKEVMSQVADIHFVIRSAIEKKNYCVLFLDEYYLHTLERKESHHYAHEVLIYGYDDDKQIYYILAFKDRHISQLEMPYPELELGYKNVFDCISRRAGWDEKMFLQFKRVESDFPYPFSLNIFLQNLKEYQMGEYTKKDTFLSLIDLRNQNGLGDEVKCGSRVMEDFKKYLGRSYIDFQNTDDIETMKSLLTCYSAFHVLRDHKKGLYERLEFVINQYNKTEVTLELLRNYAEVVQLCENTRKLFIKIDVIKNSAENINKRKVLSIVESMIKKLECAAKLEQDTLDKFMKEMEKCQI